MAHMLTAWPSAGQDISKPGRKEHQLLEDTNVVTLLPLADELTGSALSSRDPAGAGQSHDSFNCEAPLAAERENVNGGDISEPKASASGASPLQGACSTYSGYRELAAELKRRADSIGKADLAAEKKLTETLIYCAIALAASGFVLADFAVANGMKPPTKAERAKPVLLLLKFVNRKFSRALRSKWADGIDHALKTVSPDGLADHFSTHSLESCVKAAREARRGQRTRPAMKRILVSEVPANLTGKVSITMTITDNRAVYEGHVEDSARPCAGTEEPSRAGHAAEMPENESACDIQGGGDGLRGVDRAHQDHAADEIAGVVAPQFEEAP